MVIISNDGFDIVNDLFFFNFILFILFNYMYIFLFLVHSKNGDNMKIKDIMSRDLVYAEVDDNVLYVCNKMKKNDVGFVLIMDGKKLYGVVTDRDIVCDLADGNIPIKEFANTNVVSVSMDEDVSKALEMMKYKKIKRLVVTSDKTVVGVVSLSDVYNSDISSGEILKALKEIFVINRNDEDFDTDVGDFIL